MRDRMVLQDPQTSQRTYKLIRNNFGRQNAFDYMAMLKGMNMGHFYAHVKPYLSCPGVQRLLLGLSDTYNPGRMTSTTLMSQIVSSFNDRVSNDMIFDWVGSVVEADASFF